MLGWAGEDTCPYANWDGRGRASRRKLGAPLSLFLLLELSFEGVLGTVAGLGEIAVGAVLHGVGITMPELALHGVVAFLSAFVGFLRTFSAVGIIVEMIALAFHVRPFEIVNKL